MKICEYGCGQEAKFQLKNGKWCCSKSFNSCPKMREKNSKMNKGKLPPKFIEIPKGINLICSYGCKSKANYYIGKDKNPCCSKYGINCKSNLDKAIKNHLEKGYKKGIECKLTGRIRPDQSEFMKKNNPMFIEEIKNKVILVTTSKEYKKEMSKIIRNLIKNNPEYNIKRDDATRKSMKERGILVPVEILPEKEKYYKKVLYYTRKSLLKFYDIINPENKEIGFGKYSVDHKFSIIEGFKRKIDPKIIGSYINLEIILLTENWKKRHRCSITEKDLLHLYIGIESENNL